MEQKKNDDIFGLLGINPESAKEKAFTRGLLSSIFQAAALSGPQARPIGGAQALGQIGLAGIEGYESSMDRALKEMLINQQLTDAQRKRKQEIAQQAAIQSYITGLPEDQRARFQAFPTQAAEAMFRERKASPGVVGEYQAALADGLITPDVTLPQYVAMKRPPGTTVNVGEKASPFEKKAQESQAEAFSEIQKSGTTAARSARDITRLGNILDKVGTGGTAAFKQIAGNFGIKTEGLDNIQAAQAIINKLVPQQRPPGSGTMSDADLALYKESLPRLINQPGANKEIVRSMKDINDYLVKEGKIASDVLDGKLTPAQGRQKLMELGNPIQDFFERNQAASPTSPRVSLPPQDEALINRYLRK
jgi:hypothetical protein